MSNEFKVKKGLIVKGENTVLDVQGTLGQLFSVTDNLEGLLFSVNDISGLPILEVHSDNSIVMGEYGSNDFVLKDNKIGIGTDSPASLLDLHKQYTASGIYETDNLTWSTNNGSVSWLLGQITGYVAAGSGGSTGNFPGGLAFKTKPADSSILTLPTTKMVINAAGNVGIGTTSPSYKLDVLGNIGSTSLFHTSSSYIGNSINYSWGARAYDVTIEGSAGYIFSLRQINNQPIMSFDRTNGSVASPTAVIDGDILLNIKASGRNPSGTYTDHTVLQTLVDGAPSGTSVNQKVYINDAKLVVMHSGNVGIGTTNPSVKFHNVGSAILADGTTIDLDTYTGTVVAGTITDGSWTVRGIGGNNGTGDSWGIGHNGSALYFGIGNGSAIDTMQTYMRFNPNRDVYLVESSGNVGIGTTSPGYRLDISTSTNYNHFRLGGSGIPLIKFGSSTYNSGNGAELWQNTIGEFFINTNSSTVALIASATGNVGIGISPSYKLDVGGDIHANGWLRTTGSTGWYSQTYGGGWYMTDSTWIKNYNSKPLYINADIQQAGNVELYNNYTSGILGAGFSIGQTANGSVLEIDNITVRNTLRTHIFQKDIVKATNGYLYISDSGVVSGATSTTISFRADKSATFSDGMQLWIKDANSDTGAISSIKLTITNNGTFTNGTTDQDDYWTYTCTYTEGAYTDVQAGMTAVRISGGTILLDASSTYAPFIDFSDGTSVRTRIGNLSGKTTNIYGSLQGYGLWGDNAYLEGNVNIAGTLTAGDANGQGSTFYAGLIRKNLLPYSSNFSGSITGWSNVTATTYVIDSSTFGFPTIKITGGYINNSAIIRLKPNTKYTASFTVYSSGPLSSGTDNPIHIQNWTAENTGNVHQDVQQAESEMSYTGSNYWKRIKHVFLTPNSAQDIFCKVYFYNYNYANTVWIKDAQVEEGINATPLQVTDTVLTNDVGYGMWAIAGGFGGTIQNPVASLSSSGLSIRNAGTSTALTSTNNGTHIGNFTSSTGFYGTILNHNGLYGYQNNALVMKVDNSGAKLADFDITANKISSTNFEVVSGTYPYIGIGTSSYNTTGVWLGKYSTDSTYRISAVGSAGKLYWTGSYFLIRGANDATVLQTTATGATIGGWNVDGDSIYTGTKDTSGYTTGGITLYSGGSIHSKNFYIDTSGNAYLTGSITATAGSIGGWTINTNYLAKDTGTNNTSAGFSPTDYPIFIGATYANRATAPFRVTPAGYMIATSGLIANINISTDKMYIGTGTYANSNTALYLGSSGLSLTDKFSVSSAGALTATSATITGTIKATGGYIGGSTSGWLIETNKISNNSISLVAGTSPYVQFGDLPFFHADPQSIGQGNSGIIIGKSGTEWMLEAGTDTGDFFSYGTTQGLVIKGSIAGGSFTDDITVSSGKTITGGVIRTVNPGTSPYTSAVELNGTDSSLNIYSGITKFQLKPSGTLTWVYLTGGAADASTRGLIIGNSVNSNDDWVGFGYNTGSGGFMALNDATNGQSILKTTSIGLDVSRNIHTSGYVRGDSGFQVDGSYVINGDGRFIGPNKNIIKGSITVTTNANDKYIDFQVQDDAGNNIADRFVVKFWFSSTAYGVPGSGIVDFPTVNSSLDNGVLLNNSGISAVSTLYKVYEAITDANGKLRVTAYWDGSTADFVYFNFELNGLVYQTSTAVSSV